MMYALDGIKLTPVKSISLNEYDSNLSVQMYVTYVGNMVCCYICIQEYRMGPLNNDDDSIFALLLVLVLFVLLLVLFVFLLVFLG